MGRNAIRRCAVSGDGRGGGGQGLGRDAVSELKVADGNEVAVLELVVSDSVLVDEDAMRAARIDEPPSRGREIQADQFAMLARDLWAVE